MDSDSGPSLADKLKSLGVKIGAAKRTQPPPARRAAIERVVPGDYRQTRFGETFVSETRYPPGHRHGRAALLPTAPLDVVAAWAGDDRLRELPPEGFVFFDTETSGLAGGTGTYAFMVGAGRFENGEFRLAQFFMRDPAEEPALLEALAEFIAPCEALVSYNGKSFDAPLLATRYILHGIPIPFEGYAHLDLLHLSRRLWRDRLPSRTLKYIEEHVLEITRTSEEVPGCEIPWLYFDYLRSGDAAPLKGVFYHNAVDVLSLAALLSHTGDMLADPLGEAVQHNLDLIAIAKLLEDLRRWDEAARLYEHGLDGELPAEDFARAVKRLSILQRRRGDLGEAVRWWEKAAADGRVYAHVELAKYHEHRLKDYAAAQAHTRAALELVRSEDFPVYARRHWLADLEHRLGRLERKAHKESGK